MKKKQFVFVCAFSCFIVINGCDLTAPPTCVSGTEICEYDRVMNTALYSVCNDNGEWDISACGQCEDNQLLNV